MRPGKTTQTLQQSTVRTHIGNDGARVLMDSRAGCDADTAGTRCRFGGGNDNDLSMENRDARMSLGGSSCPGATVASANTTCGDDDAG